MAVNLDECLSADSVDADDAEVAAATTDGRPALRVRTGREADYCGVTLRAPSGEWDLSKYTFISLDVKNLSDEALSLVCQVADSTGKRPRNYGIDIAPGETYPVHLTIGPIAPAWTAEALPGMFCNPLGFPTGQGGWAHPNVDPTAIVSIHLALWQPRRDYTFEISNVRARGELFGASEDFVRDEKRFYPFIDRFGQYRHKEWPSKTHSEEDLQARHAEEAEDLARHPGPGGWNQYGGWAEGPRLEASGFFRPEKRDGKWWLVDPKGRLFWSHGVDCVGVVGRTRTEGRERFFEEPSAGGALAERNLVRKLGEDWMARFREQAHTRLRSWGANTIGNWSDPELCLLRRTPYTVAVHYPRPVIQGKRDEAEVGPWGYGVPDPYHPEFERNLRERLEAERGKSAGDPWCIGYFVDNEVPWWWAANVALESPAEQPAKTKLVEALRVRYGTIERLNASWETSYASWEALLATREGFRWGSPTWVKSRDDLEGFARKHHEEYFRICKQAVHDIAPDNLYLGCRFNTAGREEIAERVAAEYCDIVSYNQYKHRVAGFRLPEGIDVPVIIGEFHFGALDRGMFWYGVVPVADQAERGQAYKGYVRSALQNPAIVGAHWFAFGDEAATGRGDGENAQIGLVDICGTPYPETIAACREVGYDIYRARDHQR
jgi:hypothetical protein